MTRGEPDWGHQSRSLGVAAENRQEALAFRLMLNAYWGPRDVELPRTDGGNNWQRWIDTARETPHDILAWRDAPPDFESAYRVEARSVVVLFARGGRGAQESVS